MSRILLKFLLLTAGLAGFGGIILFLTFGLFTPAASSPIAPVSALKPVMSATMTPLTSPVAGIPLRLKIPSLKVNAAVELVGLTARGAVDVPKGPANVAWLKIGPRPGEIGSAVMDGHYGIWKNGQATVFNNLSKLRVGDKLYVIDDKGASVTFVVRRLKIYGPREDVAAVFNASDDKAHLNLITCEGVWDKVKKSYSGRLVVFTDRE